jgi:cytochrome oxidase Cu insertion factor (SCO1/SenC/PrrC family)
MDAHPLRRAVAGLVLGVITTTVPAAAQPDPFVAMNALRVMPPAPAPDATFRALDGREARLATLRGRPVLLTFFTTW